MHRLSVKTMGITVLIVQHGEKERTAGDPELTDLGQAQALRTAAYLRRAQDVAAIWSSPLLRARQTAAPIGDAFSLGLLTDPRLRERMNWIDPTNGSLEDFLGEWERASLDRSYVPTVGDSSNEAARRFIEALVGIEQRCNDGETVAVVAHGGVTVDMLRTVLGDVAVNEANPDLIPDGVPNCAITTLAVDDGRLSVAGLPNTRHLDGS